MKKLVSAILAISMVLSISGCSERSAETLKNEGISTYIREVGCAAMYEPYITQKEYPYAYEVQFKDESGNTVETLPNEQFVYLPQEELYNCDISMLEVYKLEGGELIKRESRYLYDRFMIEIKADKSGVYVVKPSEAVVEATTSGDLKFLNILVAKGVTDKEGSGENISKKDFINILKGTLGTSADVVDFGSMSGKEITRIQAAELLSKVLTAVYGVDAPSGSSEFAAKDKDQIKEDKLAFAKLVSDRNIIKLKLEKFLPDDKISKTFACEMIYKTVFLTKTEDKKAYILDTPNTFEGKSENGVISFPSVVGTKKSDTFKITANGVPVYAMKLHEESMARFIAQGETKIEIECSDDIKGAIVSPRVHGIVPTYSGNKITFTIDKPRQLIVQFGNMERLLLFAEAPETDVPDKDSEVVINVLKLGADNTGEKMTGDILQKAIDDAASSGKTLYIPNGKYKIIALHVKSGATMYLEPSAMLFSDGTVDETNAEAGTIGIYDAKNVKVYGYGIVHSNGTNIQHPTRSDIAYKGNHSILVRDSEDVTISGIYSLDSARWNTLTIRSNNVLIDNEKVINNLQYVFTDGIDNEWSRNITVQNSFMYCNDDAMCTKSWSKYYVSDDYITENILYKNNTAFNFGAAMVLGTFMDANETKNVRYENNYIISTDRAVQVRNHMSSYVHDIFWVNNLVERVYGDPRNPGDDGILINMENFQEDDGRETMKPVNKARMANLTISNLRVLADSKNPSAFEGENEVKSIKNFVIENLVIGGEKIAKDNFRANIDKFSEVIFK